MMINLNNGVKTLKIFKIITLFTVCIFFISCQISNVDESENGITINFYNYTNIEYTGYSFYIGAVKNGEFIVTDSVNVKTIINSIDTAPADRLLTNKKTGEKIALSYDGFKGSNFPFGTWRPDYEKIKAISNEYTYKLRLSDGREETFMNQLESFDNFSVGNLKLDIKKDSIVYRD